MDITNAAKHIEVIEIELGATSSKLGDDQKVQAVTKAMLELHWAYPITDPFKVYWAIERGKRHALYVLFTESAHKFKYKQINLQHRFENYLRMIKAMDLEFLTAIDEYPTMFPGVQTNQGFTQFIPAGFEYDFVGNDVTPDQIDISGTD